MHRESGTRRFSTVDSITNSRKIFLSNGDESLSSLNTLTIKGKYEGNEGPEIYYRGLIDYKGDSADLIVADTASGSSGVVFVPFATSRGVQLAETKGIRLFIINNEDENGDAGLTFSLNEPVYAVDAELNTKMREYTLNSHVDAENRKVWELISPNKISDNDNPGTGEEPGTGDEPGTGENPGAGDNPGIGMIQRPEAGGYIANTQAWAKMHMRLHDRFG